MRWWQEERHQAPERFRALNTQWKAKTAEGKDAEAKATRRKIIDLGIPALPAVLEEIGQGDTDLIPVVSALTDGKVPKTATREACATWWAENKEKWTLPAARKDDFPDPSPE
jgi:hypothetical protein